MESRYNLQDTVSESRIGNFKDRCRNGDNIFLNKLFKSSTFETEQEFFNGLQFRVQDWKRPFRPYEYLSCVNNSK